MKKIILFVIFVLLNIFGVIIYYNNNPTNKNVDTDASESKQTQYNRELIVYESDANSKDECTSYEDFDTENSVCYFECETQDECDDINKKINEELDSWTEDGAGEKENFTENENKNDKNVLATYAVSPGEKILLISGQGKDEYVDLWSEVADVSPDSLSDNYIEKFIIYNDEKDDTLAYVVDEDLNGKWGMGINLNHHKSSSLKEQKKTLVHEISHIISLNSGQVLDTEKCTNLKLDEGCASLSSYINNFYINFWKNKNTKYSEDKFVTDYAATNEVEDFAETFSYFVFTSKASETNTPRDNKIKFMYNYPELVSVRKDMRQDLGESIVRARKLAQ